MIQNYELESKVIHPRNAQWPAFAKLSASIYSVNKWWQVEPQWIPDTGTE